MTVKYSPVASPTGQCAGPFVDAWDCPVHDPRKRAQPDAELLAALDEVRGQTDKPSAVGSGSPQPDYSRFDRDFIAGFNSTPPAAAPVALQDVLENCYLLDWPYAVLMRDPNNMDTQFRTVVGVGNSREAAWENARANLKEG